MDVDDPDANLDFFLTWKVDALKLFLEKRGLSKEGTKSELAALCFAANKMNVPVQPSSNEILKANAATYSHMLKVEGGSIPDPFTVCDGWSSEKDAIKSWPPVYLSDITSFFMKKCPDTTTQHFLNDYKVGKAYQYFSSDWLKEVFFHPLADSKYCILRASCTPSMRVTHTDHKVWVCVQKKTGEIMSAYCSCTAGLGQTCNHVAGILFRLEHANRMGFVNPACTSRLCTWNVPGEKVVYGPKLLSDMVVKKSKYGKSEKARSLVSDQKKQYQPLSEVQMEQNPLVSIGKALSGILPNACLFKGLKIEETEKTTKPDNNEVKLQNQQDHSHIIDEIVKKSSLINHAKQFTPGQEKELFDSLPQLDCTEIKTLEKATKMQSDSEVWHQARKGRITASKFYAVYTKTNTIRADLTKDPKTLPLLRTLMAESEISVNPEKCPRAIKHGRNMEPTAKKDYISLNLKKHQDFIAEDSGLFLHEKHQHLGASPDLLISCSCCGKGVVEIKCPLITQCQNCTPHFCHCDDSSLSYLVKSNGHLSLKKKHPYYGQIQGQLAITGRSYCDFFVYAPFAVHQERICFDSKFWQDMLNNLNYFFINFMIPYLISSATDVSGDRCDEPMDVDIDSSSLTTTGDVFFCPVCNERVKEEENIQSFGDRSICCDSCNAWCHFKCVKITKSGLKTLKTWKCPSC